MEMRKGWWIAVLTIAFLFTESALTRHFPSVATYSFAENKKQGDERKDNGKAATYNHLAHETSPYLLQHATNPVDWYPWGNEVFEKAVREDKLIFLSIGYSTCHWCHVMAHESFEDEEVAALLNAHFVCIKVDREERPDIDKVYMAATQAITGTGGWPMTVVLTPDKKPFFAGTYFPKESRWDRRGLMEILPELAKAWKGDRQKVLENAQLTMQYLKNAGTRKPGLFPDKNVLDQAQHMLSQNFDAQHGGFGGPQKFPLPHNLTFLLRQYRRKGDREALGMVEKTLAQMRLGGIYDHLGFGFHRYATDPEWVVPHFEKMLYDQALLAIAYTEGYQSTGNQLYAQTVKEICTYVLRDMTSPEGGFYSAQDADSEGIEGKFYLWTWKEVQKILGQQEAGLFMRVYNLEENGNFIDEVYGKKRQENILYLKKPLAEVASDLDMPIESLRKRLAISSKKLMEAREKRVPPFKDDKILTDWNGLMISALAKAGRVLEEPKYIAAANRAGDFILKRLRDDRGHLLKSYRMGRAGLPAHLDDYAFMVSGLLDLYESNFDVKYLQEAISLNSIMVSKFWDEKDGGLFLTAHESEELLLRTKEVYDGAIPSGNSVAALNMLRLSHFTGKDSYSEKAKQLVNAFSADISMYPLGHTRLLEALTFALADNYEVVVVGQPGGEDTVSMLKALHKLFLPEMVVLFKSHGENASSLIRLAPFVKPMIAKDQRATAYVCQKFTCNLPTTSIVEMVKYLQPTIGEGAALAK